MRVTRSELTADVRASLLAWLERLLRMEYGTHSLRRTKASMIYRATANLRAI